MKLIWMAVPALLAVAVAGCTEDKSTTAASTSAAAESRSTSATPDAAEHEQPGSGMRIPLGDTKKVPIPADAVMDIKVPVDWGNATTSLRCTVTDSTGRNEDLRSTNATKQETIDGKEWMTLWTFSSAAGAEVTVGCKDPESKIAAGDNPVIRVIPRGITPH
ncbi:hypothetical protein OG874_26220 [Nocardia sp. NBC_00565]|uniref:hypothetical protein n=1 Tax=Nocardia sp. NBC_00565 TaxID=2975993 RepID=UPI002E7FE96A|nr:hypothetical protein [Nocardia sp. NBC_00565]WUC00386.1 hypothetical protein OG874_26220 [Nocardia sp. NBC_00565]